ncbi:hypothetical protein [Tropicimonas sp. IMCC6043]|uniref:hypothetical protein n=1 Tax=Tropicimonas sp. IMCC6043 TaxID=2510645 RepID=UPI00101D84A9|nr:hypothetical protein [Tropicimonas sp. IMCC6043]RYH08148.1 hypothetical protein EU800_17805 [Tropicimonas sp. IMCC6043]
MHTRFALFLLLAVDTTVIAIYLVLHAADQTGAITRVPDLFKINARGGLPSNLLFTKFFAMFAFLAWAGRRTGLGWVKGMALVFLLLFLDDRAELHEMFGDQMVGLFGLTGAWGIDADDIGEVLYLSLFGVICFGLLGRAYVAAPQPLRGDIVVLIGLVAVLAFFGVVVDLAAEAVRDSASDAIFNTHFVFHTLEDAGELVVASFLLVQAAKTARDLIA